MIVVILTSAFGSLAIVIIMNLLQNRRQRDARKFAASQDVLYTTAVKVRRIPKPRLLPNWALGAAGFKLLVRTRSFQVVGPGTSSTWYFDPPTTSAALIQTPTPLSGTKRWIRLRTEVDSKPGSLLIAPFPKSHLDEAWNALVSSGVKVESEPPSNAA